ncbi:AAA family ATPase [Bacillus cereus]|uniref:AAA family ATPase n=1 Tax=Bacillus cereus group TaxID=86661 RepID=UPI0018D0CE23|nr:AAA family ATPase [Bacillus cereus]MBH0318454.1 AAA family ATPase [Bacillus cereus]
MKLKKIYIGKYKHLRDFKISFANVDGLVHKTPFRFFIGRNGVGKSIIFEAIGLIFTRILHDESPGFPFEIVYSINIKGKEFEVTVRPNSDLEQDISIEEKVSKEFDLTSKIMVWVQDPRGYKKRLDLQQEKFSQRFMYHPKRIVAQSSGPTNSLEDVLIISPVDSLKSDIYDVQEGASTKKDYNERTYEIKDTIEKIMRLNEESQFLFINGKTAILVLLVLCAVIPKVDKLGVEKYEQLRRNLFEMLGGLLPISFSLIADEEKIQKLLHSEDRKLTSPQRQFLELMLSQREAEKYGYQSCNNWVSYRSCREERKDYKKDFNFQTNPRSERVAIFDIKQKLENDYYTSYCPNINEGRNPMDLLTVLLIAKREKLLLEAHLSFKIKKQPELLMETALSDGEYLWLTRLGLILILRYEQDCLFMFDEPDVHMNESWNVDFVKALHEMTNINEEGSTHEFLIATHSTLLITDAAPDQLYHFVANENGEPQRQFDDMSSFAASRDEISIRIFNTKDSIGRYSRDLLHDALNKESELSIEDLEELYHSTGFGIHKFRIRDRILEIERKNKMHKKGED